MLCPKYIEFRFINFGNGRKYKNVNRYTTFGS